MKKYIQYFKYLVRHKWYVFLAGLETGAPIWRLIIHDWSKFLPSEWFAYMEYFYGNHLDDNEAIRCSLICGSCHPKITKKYWNQRFKMAWLLHQRRNKHHWQYWCLRNDNGETYYLDIPEIYAREMVADWAGAGKAITGKWEVKSWYDKNKDIIKLHDNSRKLVEELINKNF